MVPMVSLLQRFHCTGQLTVVQVVSLLQRFHCISLVVRLSFGCHFIPPSSTVGSNGPTMSTRLYTVYVQ